MDRMNSNVIQDVVFQLVLDVIKKITVEITPMNLIVRMLLVELLNSLALTDIAFLKCGNVTVKMIAKMVLTREISALNVPALTFNLHVLALDIVYRKAGYVTEMTIVSINKMKKIALL